MPGNWHETPVEGHNADLNQSLFDSIFQIFGVAENPKHIWPCPVFQDKLYPYVFDSFTCNSLTQHAEGVI